MSNLKTKILWYLNDYCKSECSYCPTKFRGGDLPHETKDYIRVANLLISNYRNMGRSIDWVFNGGEPLDMNDIVTLLKLCRENGNSMELHTNGGKLWMDWWAIEPYVDMLYLTYHYWQNPALINYIIETFFNKNKKIIVMVPIRPDHFEEDINRAYDIENRYRLTVTKFKLYNNADQTAGMFPYEPVQLAEMHGVQIKPKKEKPIVEKPIQQDIKKVIESVPAVQELRNFQTTTWDQRYEQRMNSNPSFTGMLCNVGIENLVIQHQGWVNGSDCRNQPLGNIWHEGWTPPSAPQICTMKVCESETDRKITKFPA